MRKLWKIELYKEVSTKVDRQQKQVSTKVDSYNIKEANGILRKSKCPQKWTSNKKTSVHKSGQL